MLSCRRRCCSGCHKVSIDMHRCKCLEDVLYQIHGVVSHMAWRVRVVSHHRGRR